jgi:membrane-bound lytic murein transglycosylase D
VKAGDTLERIADRFDVTPYQLRRWNKLQTSRLVAGKRLRIYVATGAVRSSRTRRAKAVASGTQTKKKPAPVGSSPAAATPKPAQRASQPAR